MQDNSLSTLLSALTARFLYRWLQGDGIPAGWFAKGKSKQQEVSSLPCSLHLVVSAITLEWLLTFLNLLSKLVPFAGLPLISVLCLP